MRKVESSKIYRIIHKLKAKLLFFRLFSGFSWVFRKIRIKYRRKIHNFIWIRRMLILFTILKIHSRNLEKFRIIFTSKMLSLRKEDKHWKLQAISNSISFGKVKFKGQKFCSKVQKLKASLIFKVRSQKAKAKVIWYSSFTTLTRRQMEMKIDSFYVLTYFGGSIESFTKHLTNLETYKGWFRSWEIGKKTSFREKRIKIFYSRFRIFNQFQKPSSSFHQNDHTSFEEMSISIIIR